MEKLQPTAAGRFRYYAAIATSPTRKRDRSRLELGSAENAPVLELLLSHNEPAANRARGAHYIARAAVHF